METKSRYEVIAELEQQKRKLILERDSFEDKVKAKERHIKDLKREVEDAEEDLEALKGRIDDRKITIAELIKSVDDSLKRFTDSKSQGINTSSPCYRTGRKKIE